MTEIERKFYKLLLILDACAIVIGMVAGPLDHTTISLSASVCAGIISLAVIGYGLYFWPKRK
jgi:hypothetical protein